ncbi:MAG: hypothetical protein V3S76_01260 [Candidatus Bipolaricaulota bacterium]
MNIWNLRSAVIIWIFAWGWLYAFDSCAPTRERWSVEHREEQVAEDNRQAAEAEAARVAQAEQDAMCASTNRVLEICNPPEEVSFLCKIFDCEDEEEGEASSP